MSAIPSPNWSGREAAHPEYFLLALHDRQARHPPRHAARPWRKRHQVPVVYVNQVGGNDSLIFDGSSVAFLPDGRVAALARSFEEDLVFFEQSTGAGDIRPQISDELEAAYLRFGAGHARLRAQMRFPQGRHRIERRHRFGPRGHHRRRCSRRRKRDRRRACRGPTPRREACWTRANLAENLGIQLLVLANHRHIQQLSRCSGRCLCRPSRPDVAEENIQARIRGNLLMAFRINSARWCSAPAINRKWPSGIARSTATWPAASP